MKSLPSWTLVLLLLSLPATPQGRGWPKPPAPAEPNPVAQNHGPVWKSHADSLQLQREARELSDLANSLPTEIDLVTHGLLSKDLPEKLKRIEKLSKHLRGEIQP